MSRLSDPRAEKARDYTHQRVIVAEYPHLWVKAKRKKKRGTQRSYRRRVKQVLDQQTPLHDALESKLPETVQRERAYHHSGSTQSLGTAVKYRLERRAEVVAFNLFKKTYDSQKHRTRFTALLQGLICSNGEKNFVRELALQLHLYLNPEEASNQPGYREFYQRRNLWLEAFFDDEPTLKPRLQAWIARVFERS